MKKLPKKFTIALIMMPTMLLGMPAILIYRSLPQAAPFLDAWLSAVGQMASPALVMVLVVGSLARSIVTRFLVETRAG